MLFGMPGVFCFPIGGKLSRVFAHSAEVYLLEDHQQVPRYQTMLWLGVLVST